MKAFTTARCGSDMEVRFLQNGDPIGTVSLAVRLGKKDKATGEYMTQWVKATLWGKRAESLAPRIKKGSLHAFHLRDLRIEEYTTKDGLNKSAMVAEIDDVELCGNSQSERSEPEQQASRAEPSPRGGGASGLADMESDIPF